MSENVLSNKVCFKEAGIQGCEIEIDNRKLEGVLDKLSYTKNWYRLVIIANRQGALIVSFVFYSFCSSLSSSCYLLSTIIVLLVYLALFLSYFYLYLCAPWHRDLVSFSISCKKQTSDKIQRANGTWFVNNVQIEHSLVLFQPTNDYWFFITVRENNHFEKQQEMHRDRTSFCFDEKYDERRTGILF